MQQDPNVRYTSKRKPFVLRRCDESDIDKMAAIYRTVFPTYPFPIYDPSYLLETMHSHVVYFGAEAEGELVALSSAEIDTSANNVEMTDFAALLKWQRNSLSGHLLLRMEEEMKRQGIKTAYTIARAMSPGINITFSKLGYTYGGRLINNTNISAHIESMNVWYKMMS
jgi:putative beta-lysine N-acetyltransferase